MKGVRLDSIVSFVVFFSREEFVALLDDTFGWSGSMTCFALLRLI